MSEPEVTITVWEVVVAIAAIWGAALSTYIYIRQSIQAKPKVTVKLRDGMLIGPVPGRLSDYENLDFTAINERPIPVTLNSIGYEVKGVKGRFVLIPPMESPQLPAEVTQGKSWSTWIESRVIAAFMVKEKDLKGSVEVRCFFKDETDRIYKSDYIDFDIDRHLQE